MADYVVSAAADTLCFASQKNITRMGINVEYMSTFRFGSTLFHCELISGFSKLTSRSVTEGIKSHAVTF